MRSRDMLVKKCLAEILGTFWLAFGGCGSAVLAAMFIAKEGSTPINLGIALVGVSFAFGLTVLTMAYAIGHISGCHLNPAVSIGLLFGGRFKAQDLLPYIGSQVIGAIAGAGVLFFIFTNGEVNGVAQTVGATPGSFATNGYGDHSPGAVKYSVAACALGEFVLTFFFLLIILGSTDRRAPGGFAPIPIGLGLTLIHLIGIPLTNTSVNPARSTGPALFVGGVALQQLWLFWAAPIAGAVAAGLLYRFAFEAKHDGK